MTLLTEEIRALVGREVSYVAPEPLGRAAGRYFARAIGDHNPLYRDDAAAAAAGLDSVIVPPTLLFETNQYADLARDPDGYAGHHWPIPVPPGGRLVRGGNAYRWHRDVRPDDVVTATWRLADITERTGGGGRPMLIVSSECRYTDQHGAPIAEQTETIIVLGGAA